MLLPFGATISLDTSLKFTLSHTALAFQQQSRRNRMITLRHTILCLSPRPPKRRVLIPPSRIAEMSLRHDLGFRNSKIERKIAVHEHHRVTGVGTILNVHCPPAPFVNHVDGAISADIISRERAWSRVEERRASRTKKEERPLFLAIYLGYFGISFKAMSRKGARRNKRNNVNYFFTSYVSIQLSGVSC
jgi:hypothetical protein